MTAEQITAITGLLTAVGGLIVTLWRVYKRLCDRIDEIEKRNQQKIDELERRYERKIAMLEEKYERENRDKRRLLEYVAQLRCIMISAGLSVPDMPQLEGDYVRQNHSECGHRD